ncbi:cation:proton antiporter [Granulicoccus sp. GXG6511]|uniref:cation:proton antiporter n=1 Tax=Granulicoccus sp. GXG6511 TaxID=3381351 RepID=UPI003D7D8C5B
MESLVVLIGGLYVVYGLFSQRLQRSWVTGPIIFTTAGLLAGSVGLGLFTAPIESGVIGHIAEVTLAMVLFGDAARTDLTSLRHPQLAVRSLALGLPLVMALGTLVAWFILGDATWLIAGLIAVIVAPTDAALGKAVIDNESVPGPTRETLNVESGLNDGLAAPIFAVMLAAALGDDPPSLAGQLAIDVGLGLVIGVTVGAITLWGIRWADRHDWTTGEWERIVALATALLCWAGAEAVGSNGFIAAFTAGLVWARLSKRYARDLTDFLEAEGQLVSLWVWFTFGALLVGPLLSELTWRVVMFAVISLLVVRPLAFVVASAFMKVRWPTVAFIGWFGPRGLASIVFGIEAIEALNGPDRTIVASTVTLTVLLSVFLHGVTAKPLADLYSRASPTDEQASAHQD